MDSAMYFYVVNLNANIILAQPHQTDELVIHLEKKMNLNCSNQTCYSKEPYLLKDAKAMDRRKAHEKFKRSWYTFYLLWLFQKRFK